jgi:5-methylcytosine-specific restriction protein B
VGEGKYLTHFATVKKRESVRTTWGWSGTELSEDHLMLADPVLAGIGSPGVAYTTQRWRELSDQITFMRTFKQLGAEQRQALGTDLECGPAGGQHMRLWFAPQQQ